MGGRHYQAYASGEGTDFCFLMIEYFNDKKERRYKNIAFSVFSSSD